MTAVGFLSAWLGFFVVSASLPAVLWLAKRRNILDVPGALTIHLRPICRLGGVSIALGIFSTVVLFVPPSPSRNTFLTALAVIWMIGLTDDIRHLSPWTRLVLQIFGALIAWLGLRGAFSTKGVLDALLCTLWSLTYINAFNFLDGSDGLAAGVASTLAVSFAAMFCIGQHPVLLGGIVAFAMAGASLAFLICNWPPAQVFLGDSGSCTLGFGVAYASLVLFQPRTSTRASLLAPLVCSALPLLDLAWAVIRRLRAGRSPMFGDRRHLPDLLLQRGWSAQRVALSYCTATLVFCVAAWTALARGETAMIGTSLTIGAALSWLGWKLGVFRMSNEAPIEGKRAARQSAKFGKKLKFDRV